ncbi:MAG: DUF434 domain-containing protein [Candidatus Hadarchaeales archaeon]
MWSERTEDAIRDLRYLLDRGYPRETAVRVVSDHYCLPSRERHLLTRCVFSRGEAEEHGKKLVSWREVRRRTVGVDGYNVLITCESLLRGDPVIRCDDGLLRDLRTVFGKYRVGEHTWEVLEEVALLLEKAEPREVRVFFDSPASGSGELARKTGEILERRGVEAVCRAVRGVDREVSSCEISASSDRVIVERARAVWDLPAELLRRKGGEVLDLSRVPRFPP